MTLSNITAFAFATPNRGDNNQLIGAFHAISDMVNPKWDYANSFLFANDETDIYQVKEVFSYSNFKNYEIFQTKVFEKIDAYFKKLTFIPKIFIIVYGQTEAQLASANVDMMCKAVKEYYTIHKLGFVLTSVLNSKYHRYKYVDVIYEKALLHPRIIFQNSKNIAQNKDDEKRWRIYSGKHKQDFTLLSKIGNIYPAVLGFENTLVVHSFDTYACCETLNASVPTAISSKGLYINPKIRYDCFNLQELLCPKYAVDFDDFLNNVISYKIEPKDLKLQTLSNPSKVFAETLINKFKDFS